MEKVGFEGTGGTLLSSPPLLPPHGRQERLAEPPKCVAISRNDTGRNGSCIDLVANHFKVSVTDPDAHFFQYSVLIKSEENLEVERKDIGRKVMDKLYQTNSSELAGHNFAYDGEKFLYTVGSLPQKKFEFTVVLEEAAVKRSGSLDLTGMETDHKRTGGSLRFKTFNVEIRFVARLPMKPIARALKGLEVEDVGNALEVIDTILRQQATKRRSLVQQSFIHNDVRTFVNVGGEGTFHSSFRTTKGDLPLNLDVSSTMIVTPTPVLDFILTNQNLRDPREIDWGRAKKMLKNLRVKAAHTNKEFQIIGISEKACNQQYFPLKMRSGDGSTEETVEITVYEYFKNRKIELSNSACMPCLEVGKLNRLTYLPLELCSLISSQRCTKALSSMQRASLIEKSRQKLQERIQTVTDLKIGISEDCIPRRWDFNQKRLLSSIQIKHWAIVNFSAHCDFSYLSQELIKCGRSKGIHIDNPHSLIEEDPQWRGAVPVVRVEKLFKQVKAKLPGRPDFLLCIFPERKNSDIYGPWKKCLHEMGIFTQCLSPTKIDDQHLTNILLKIIFKPGSMNSLLEADRIPNFLRLEETPTMISGIDVSNGSPGQSDFLSLTAVVGSSLWPPISSYREPVRTLPPMKAMIESFSKLLSNGEDDGIIRDCVMDVSSGTLIVAMKYDGGIFCASDSKLVNHRTDHEESQPKIDFLGDNVVLLFSGNMGRYVILRTYIDRIIEVRLRGSRTLDIDEIAYRLQDSLVRTSRSNGCFGRKLRVFVCGYHHIMRVPKIYIVSDSWSRVRECDFCIGGSGLHKIEEGVHFDFPASDFFPKERTACEVIGAVQAAIELDPENCGAPLWLCHITEDNVGGLIEIPA